MWLPLSPAGREIIELHGDPGTIRRRGSQIISMGSRMISGADFLQSLSDQTDDQRGEAVGKLREIVGETHHELRRAGKMYKPTGTVLVDYANALADCLPRVKSAVDTCEIRWQSYQSSPGYLDGQRPTWGAPDAGTPEAEADAADDAAKQRRYDSFISGAQVFDREMDTWEDAFDTAVDSIGTILDGGIQDSFWDNVDGFVAGVLVILQWAGIILAIAAIIIGGPIIALLGAIAGVLTLALTIYQFTRGDTGLTQLLLAVVGVIPFGSMGKLFQGNPGRLAFLGDAFTAFRPSAWSAAITQGQTLSVISRFAGGGTSGFLAGGRAFLTMNNPTGVGDIMTRLMFGKDTNRLSQMADALGGGANGFCLSTTLPAAWEFGHTIVSGSWNLVDRIATWTGNGDKKPSSLFPWVGAVL